MKNPADNPRNPAVPYCAAVKAHEEIKTGPVLDWGWLKIDRALHHSYGPEFHVSVRWPARKRVFFSFNYDGYAVGTPTLFVAFGRVNITRNGWHARGQIIHTRVTALDGAESMAIERATKRGQKPRRMGNGPYKL